MAIGNRIHLGEFNPVAFMSIAYLFERDQITGAQARGMMNEALTGLSDWVGSPDVLSPAEEADLQTIISNVRNGVVVNGAPMTAQYVQAVFLLQGSGVTMLNTPAKIEAALGL